MIRFIINNEGKRVPGDEFKRWWMGFRILEHRHVGMQFMAAALVLFWGAHAWGANNCGPPKRSAQTFFVGTNGNDLNDGTAKSKPKRSVQAGVNCLTEPGDKLVIVPGRYTEFVEVKGKSGSEENPILIERDASSTGPVIIQGSLKKHEDSNHVFTFHTGSSTRPNNEWTLVNPSLQEYVSKHPVLPKNVSKERSVNRAAFVNDVNGRYTRLITYTRIEDLRSRSETFERICERPGVPTGEKFGKDPRDGPTVPAKQPTEEEEPEKENSCAAQGCKDCQERRPWVYMGPGVWFDENSRKVHIRLSPTHNRVKELPDYAGETDPNKVALSITEKKSNTLLIAGSKHLQFKNLVLGFSGATVRVQNSTNITFDHVKIRAGEFGVKAAAKADDLVFSNCSLDGGLPTWMFRTDLKNDYEFTLPGSPLLKNNLGKQTMDSLVDGNPDNAKTEFHHCEFVNAHDLYLTGKNFHFHHNYIGNLNDEALFLDQGDSSGQIHHNVVEQTLSAISFAGESEKSKEAGPWYIYRNLIDLRKRTAGYRPRNHDFELKHVWRAGFPFKSNEPNGTYHVFHNTFIVPFEGGRASGGDPNFVKSSFDHFKAPLAAGATRTAFNNIFAVLDRESGVDAPIAHLADRDEVDVRSNGNLYFRLGPVSRFLLFDLPETKSFECISQSCNWGGTDFFKATEKSRPPGDEANGLLLQDPQFQLWTGESNDDDDFRLKPASPARNVAVPLPPKLRELDMADSSGPLSPDIGLYPAAPPFGEAPKLRVGVGGRKVYPGK